MILKELDLDSNFVKTIHPRWQRMSYKVAILFLSGKYSCPGTDIYNNFESPEKLRRLIQFCLHLHELEKWRTYSKNIALYLLSIISNSLVSNQKI